MRRNLGPSPAHRSETVSAAMPVGAQSGRRHVGARGYAAPLAGLGAVVAIGLIIALAIGLFYGSFTETVPVTVITDRAGLVMNPEAKVTMRGVQVGSVTSIEERPDGSAALHLALDPSQLHRIPSNVGVDIASTTAFGAKYVDFIPPRGASPKKMHAGQVLQGQHVTVEINTVFQQLTKVLARIDPTKLNQTLGAIAQAFNGRGEKLGQTLVDFNALLAEIEPSLPNLSHDIETAAPVFNAYADAALDLVRTIDNSTRLSKTIVDEQHNLDAFLVSSIGLADIGNDVIGSNREGLKNVLGLLVPTTGLLSKYHEGLWCGVAGLIPFTKLPPVPQPGVTTLIGWEFGPERYRYPRDLPKVNAKGRPYCREMGLPDVPFEYVPPMVVADTGADPTRYGNQGILLNSNRLKQFLYGPIDGPARNTPQLGMPG